MLKKVNFYTRGYSIGDRIGLFPIAYADRVLYSSQRDGFREEEDLYIISETVNKVMIEMLITLYKTLRSIFTAIPGTWTTPGPPSAARSRGWRRASSA